MSEIIQPEQLSRLLAEIRSRLHALETAPRAVVTSLSGGSIIVYDDAGLEVLQYGRNPINGSYGLVMFNDTGGATITVGDFSAGNRGFRVKSQLNAHPTANQDLFRISEDGWEFPRMQIPLTPSPGGGGTYQTGVPQLVTNSGSYVELHRCDFDSVGATISYDLFRYVGAGVTTMDWRLRVYEVGGGTPQTLASQTGQGSSGQAAGSATIPTSCILSGTDVRGRNMTLRLEALVATGAGYTGIAPATPLQNYDA